MVLAARKQEGGPTLKDLLLKLKSEVLALAHFLSPFLLWKPIGFPLM